MTKSPRWASPVIKRAIWAVPAITVAVLYAQVYSHQYIDFDDNAYTFDNAHVASGLTWENIKWAFTTFFIANYHPLTWLSYMLDFQLFGISPGIEVSINAGFHLLNAILISYLFKRLFNSTGTAILIGCIFASHPVMVEAVAWISQRKTQLATFFGLLSVLGYLSYCDEKANRRRILLFGVSILFFALSLLSKAMLVTMPAVLLLLRAIQTEERARRQDDSTSTFTLRAVLKMVPSLLPFVLLSGAASFVTYRAQAQGGAVADINYVTLTDRVANILHGYNLYFKHFFLPSDLSVFYPLDLAWSLDSVLVSGGILLAITIVLYLSNRRCGPTPFLGWLFFLFTLVPVIGLVQVGEQASADRYMYQPIIGILIIVASVGGLLWRLAKALLPNLARFLPLCVGMWLVCAALVSYQQISYWNNTYVLVIRSIENSGESAMLLAMKSTILLRSGHYAEAAEAATRALFLQPQNTVAVQNLSVAEFCLGNVEKAAAAGWNSVRLSPHRAAVYINLAIIYKKNGQPIEAKKLLEVAAKLSAGDHMLTEKRMITGLTKEVEQMLHNVRP